MLQVNSLTITHRKDLRTIIRNFSVVLNPGDKAVLIGEEGNGKSTLMKWIYNPHLIEDYADAEGLRTTQGEVLGYLPQELSDADKGKKVYQYFSELQAFQAANPAELYRMSSELGFRDELFYSSQVMSSLSGGERVKLQMAGLLLAAPDILLLDEPSNDIDIETLEWLEKLINRFRGRLLLEQLRRKSVPRVTIANVPFRTFMEERQKSFSKQEQMAYSERREEKKAMERFRRIEQSVESDLRTISRQDPAGGRLLKKKMKAVKSMERRYEREHDEMTEIPEAETAINIRFEKQKPMPAGKTVLNLSLPELKSPDGQNSGENVRLKVRGGVGKTTLLRKVAEELCRRTDLSACYMPQNYEETLPFELTPVEYLAPSGNKG